jgi:hypothetical protein
MPYFVSEFDYVLPPELIAQAKQSAKPAPAAAPASNEHDDLLDSLGI